MSGSMLTVFGSGQGRGVECWEGASGCQGRSVRASLVRGWTGDRLGAGIGRVMVGRRSWWGGKGKNNGLPSFYENAPLEKIDWYLVLWAGFFIKKPIVCLSLPKRWFLPPVN